MKALTTMVVSGNTNDDYDVLDAAICAALASDGGDGS